jgi:hypothetical protein
MSCRLGRGCSRTTIRSTPPSEIDSVVAQLRSQVSQDGLDVTPINRLAGAAGTLEELTERFTTDNAF